MAASDFFSGVPPELLSRVLRTGQLGDEETALRQRMARAQSRQQQATPRYTNPLAAALGGLAGAANAGIGAYEETQAQNGLAALGKERIAGRQALADAYTGGMRRQRVTAPDVVAPNIGMPDATDEQSAQAAALRGEQQREREDDVRQGTAYLGLLSGDAGIRDFSNALLKEGSAETQAQRLNLSMERMRQQGELARKRLEQGDKRLTQQADGAEARARAAAERAAAKKVADALKIEEGLRKEVTGSPVFKNFVDSEVSHNNLLTASRDPSSAGDLAMIFEFMKTLDPTSVVKEGEQIQVQNATNIPGQYLNMLERFRSGQRLSPEQRADLVRVAGNIMGNKRAAVQKLVDGYRGITERAGADFRNVMPLSIGGSAAAPLEPSTPRVATPATPTGGAGADIDLNATPVPAPSGAPAVLMLPDGRRVRRNADGTYSPE